MSSIISQQSKTKKRISFSCNMVFQEIDEDGTTRTYQEKVEPSFEKLDETSMAMTLEEDSLAQLNTTLFDTDMDLSHSCEPDPEEIASEFSLANSTHLGDPILQLNSSVKLKQDSPKAQPIDQSPTLPLSNRSSYSTRASPQVLVNQSPVAALQLDKSSESVNVTLDFSVLQSPIAPQLGRSSESITNSCQLPVDQFHSPAASPRVSIAPSPKVEQLNCSAGSPKVSLQDSPKFSLQDSPKFSLQDSPIKLLHDTMIQSPVGTQLNGSNKISSQSSDVQSLMFSQINSPLYQPVAPRKRSGTPAVSRPSIARSFNDFQFDSTRISIVPKSPRVSMAPSLAFSETDDQPCSEAEPEELSFDFTLENVNETGRKSSNRYSLIESQAQTNLGDSILFYVQDNSVLQLSSEEEISPVKSKSAINDTTFVGSLFNDCSIIDETIYSDDPIDFVDNSIFLKIPEILVDISSVDARLHKYVQEINNDGATLSYWNNNFLVKLNFSLLDDKNDKNEVTISDITVDCLIDSKIKEKGYAKLSQCSPWVVEEKDDKLKTLLKKTVSTCFNQFAKRNKKTTTSLSSIIDDLRKLFMPMEALFVELFNATRFHEWKIINADIRNFEIGFEVYGLRYELWLVLCFDCFGYPHDNIKVKFGIHKADLKLYPYHLFQRVMRSVPTGKYNYIGEMIKTAKRFILDWRKNHKEKKTIRLSIHPGRKTLGDQTIKKTMEA